MDFLNKKGILFTISAVLVSTFFIMMFSAQTSVPLDANVDTLRFRVSLIDRYRLSWEDYASESLKVVSYRSLQEISNYFAANSYPGGTHPFDSETELKDNFKNCVQNGTLNMGMGEIHCSSDGEKNNVTIQRFLNEIANLAASNLSINTSFTIIDMKLSQELPFFVVVEMNLSYEVRDEIAKIKRNMSIRADVPIEGLVEPLALTLKNNGFISNNEPRIIKRSYIKGSEWNPTKLEEFVQNKHYRHNEEAPSYLMRLVGDMSSSPCCGIETVYSEDAGIDGLARLENRSYVDYMYYRDVQVPSFKCTEIFRPSSMTSVQLDQENMASFNITTDQWLTGCIP